jgi:MFS family permease
MGLDEHAHPRTVCGLVGRRIVRHPSPIVDPAMLAVRSFCAATLGSLLFFIGFAAMLLASVLFLTGIWHEPILTAGLMISPGPAMAALCAVPGARLGRRFGPGRIGAIGTVLFALGGAWWISRLGPSPHYAGDYLPGMLIGGIGVGLVIPSLTGAVAATLPPSRLATGIGVQTTGRQLGSALGFAILIAVLGTPHTAQDFVGAWTFMLVASLLAGVSLLTVGSVPRAVAADTPLAGPVGAPAAGLGYAPSANRTSASAAGHADVPAAGRISV